MEISSSRRQRQILPNEKEPAASEFTPGSTSLNTLDVVHPPLHVRVGTLLVCSTVIYYTQI